LCAKKIKNLVYFFGKINHQSGKQLDPTLWPDPMFWLNPKTRPRNFNPNRRPETRPELLAWVATTLARYEPKWNGMKSVLVGHKLFVMLDGCVWWVKAKLFFFPF